jgi:prepilin-type N-terminal cleavage/methylation domain-containing protein
MNHAHAVSREERPEDGFTLIELMMVVLIIAILIAVLIPTFVGAKSRAQDRAAQSSVRNALTAARVLFSDHGDFTDATVAALNATEPSIGFVDATTPSSGPNAVSTNPASATYCGLAGQSRSGSCFFVSDDESAAGLGIRFAKASGACTASSAPATASASWGPTW